MDPLKQLLLVLIESDSDDASTIDQGKTVGVVGTLVAEIPVTPP